MHNGGLSTSAFIEDLPRGPVLYADVTVRAIEHIRLAPFVEQLELIDCSSNRYKGGEWRGCIGIGRQIIQRAGIPLRISVDIRGVHAHLTQGALRTNVVDTNLDRPSLATRPLRQNVSETQEKMASGSVGTYVVHLVVSVVRNCTNLRRCRVQLHGIVLEDQRPGFIS